MDISKLKKTLRSIAVVEKQMVAASKAGREGEAEELIDKNDKLTDSVMGECLDIMKLLARCGLIDVCVPGLVSKHNMPIPMHRDMHVSFEGVIVLHVKAPPKGAKLKKGR